jgi:signal transduction histidine kinase
MSRRNWITPLCICGAGASAAAIAAAAGAVPAHDAVRLLVESVLGSGAVVALSLTVLRLVRQARLGVQIAVAAMAPVLAVAVGIVWATSSMFLMGHDLAVLWVVLIGAGTVGMVAALLLGRRVAAASRMVGLLARSLGEHPAQPASTGLDRVPGELAGVADELRATSARLTEARELAAANERARQELVSWVSHDLRTPLGGIRLMVEALEDGLVDDPATVGRYYATMRREADRLAALVDDLFELSRIQSGSMRLDPARCVLHELVHDAVGAATPAAQAKGVELRHEASGPGDRSWADIDEAAIARVVRNLLDNAIRHTPAGGRVHVVSGRLDERCRAFVSVSDTCGGIADDDLPRIFDAGYRGDAARTPGPTGGGHGLAIARGLVEAHKGTIGVHNTGEGCCFEVELPVAAVSADRPEDLPTPLSSPPLPIADPASTPAQ